jgi:hypothetical protein
MTLDADASIATGLDLQYSTPSSTIFRGSFCHKVVLDWVPRHHPIGSPLS